MSVTPTRPDHIFMLTSSWGRTLCSKGPGGDHGTVEAPTAPAQGKSEARMSHRTRPGTAPPPARARQAPGRAPRRVDAQYVQFLAVGFSNALVDLGTLNLLLVLYPTHAVLSLLADNTFAVALAILNSYLWNTRWTFRTTATRSGRQRLLFGMQALLNIALNNLVLFSLSGLLPSAPGIGYLIGSNAVKLVAMLVASTTSFVILRTVVFRALPDATRSQAETARVG